MKLGRLKVRDLVRSLRKLGGTPIRQSGSHEIWRMPDGKKVPVVVSHMNDACTPGVLRMVREALGYVPGLDAA